MKGLRVVRVGVMVEADVGVLIRGYELESNARVGIVLI